MADQFIAEIRMFAGNFAPAGWALCNGQLLPISQNTALFSLLGTFYGGDGKTTFALPNLQASAPLHPGLGPGLSPRDLGEAGGSRSVSLIQTEIPAHTHAPMAAATGGQASPQFNTWASSGFGRPAVYAPSTSPRVQMNPLAIAPAGGGLPHNNMPPYLGITFIIALQGIFPPRG